jgi:nucleoside 2-deoxyribosyltransferase
MNCFVIMPFASEFDDVYDAVKTAIEDAVEEPGSCARVDESRPAGRITDRLIRELRSASFCVADITHEKPNVMWELGYAMALHKPTIANAKSRGVRAYYRHSKFSDLSVA